MANFGSPYRSLRLYRNEEYHCLQRNPLCHPISTSCILRSLETLSMKRVKGRQCDCHVCPQSLPLLQGIPAHALPCTNLWNEFYIGFVVCRQVRLFTSSSFISSFCFYDKWVIHEVEKPLPCFPG